MILKKKKSSCSLATRTFTNFNIDVSKGFSLLELLVVLAIVAIILAFALPSIQTSFNNIELKKVAERLFYNIKLTRSYALANYVKAKICAGNENGGCRGINWEKGYLIEVNNKIAQGEPEIKNQSIRILKNNYGKAMSVNGGGFATSTSNSFGVCAKNSNRLYWLAVRAKNKGYLGSEPYMLTLKLVKTKCENLKNSDMNKNNIKDLVEVFNE